MIVFRCMLREAEKIYRYTVLGSLVFPHPVSSVKACGQIVMFRNCEEFYECCDKNFLCADDRCIYN